MVQRQHVVPCTMQAPTDCILYLPQFHSFYERKQFWRKKQKFGSCGTLSAVVSGCVGIIRGKSRCKIVKTVVMDKIYGDERI